MSGQGISRANANKKIRQEALREQLAAQQHVDHVNNIADKLLNLDLRLESEEIHRLKAAADIKLKLINKYLPDLKAAELNIGGQDDNPLIISKIERVIVNPGK